jgi:hypothetical protein
VQGEVALNNEDHGERDASFLPPKKRKRVDQESTGTDADAGNIDGGSSTVEEKKTPTTLKPSKTLTVSSVIVTDDEAFARAIYAEENGLRSRRASTSASSSSKKAKSIPLGEGGGAGDVDGKKDGDRPKRKLQKNIKYEEKSTVPDDATISPPLPPTQEASRTLKRKRSISSVKEDALSSKPLSGHCKACGTSSDPLDLLPCEACKDEFHLFCLENPLSLMPENPWYCKSCESR